MQITDTFVRFVCHENKVTFAVFLSLCSLSQMILICSTFNCVYCNYYSVQLDMGRAQFLNQVVRLAAQTASLMQYKITYSRCYSNAS